MGAFFLNCWIKFRNLQDGSWNGKDCNKTKRSPLVGMVRAKRDLLYKLSVFIFQSDIFINQSFLFTIQIGTNKEITFICTKSYYLQVVSFKAKNFLPVELQETLK